MAEEFRSEDIKTIKEGLRATTERAWLELPQKLEKARKLGYDEGKIRLGYALDHITGDDANAFSSLLSSYHNFNPELSQLSREMILARMGWEEGIEELPAELRDRIKAVKGKLKASDWKSQEGFRKAYQVWKTEIMDYFIGFEQSNPEFKEAKTLYRTMDERIAKDNLDSTPTESFLK